MYSILLWVLDRHSETVLDSVERDTKKSCRMVEPVYLLRDNWQKSENFAFKNKIQKIWEIEMSLLSLHTK